MSKLTDKLSTIGIHNTYEIASDGMPIVTYCGESRERFSRGARWSVCFKNRKLKNSAWYENGGKDFVVFSASRDKDKVLQEALTFVKTIRPNVEMVKAPFRMTYVAKTDLERVMKLLKEKTDG